MEPEERTGQFAMDVLVNGKRALLAVCRGFNVFGAAVTRTWLVQTLLSSFETVVRRVCPVAN